MSIMKERMHTGELYLPGDDEIMEWQTKCLDRFYEFNMTRPTEFEKRQTMMKEMFAEIGENCYIGAAFSFQFRRRSCPLREKHLLQFWLHIC